LEEQGDVFMEPLLVVFDLDDVIGFFFDDNSIPFGIQNAATHRNIK